VIQLIRSRTQTTPPNTDTKECIQPEFGSYAECGQLKQVTRKKQQCLTSQAHFTLRTTSTKALSSTSTLIHSHMPIGLMSGVSVTSSPSEDAHISCISTLSTQVV
jgi:hypothetical protein